MLRERLNKDLLIFDGGFGSQLQELGMKAGEIPEYYNIEHPEMIIDIHHRYLKAGADFITTNTFGANPLKLEQHKYSYQEVILAAIQNAKEAKKLQEKQTKHKEKEVKETPKAITKPVAVVASKTTPSK